MVLHHPRGSRSPSKRCLMKTYKTRFGSLADYQKGTIDLIDDDPKRYAFSNIFEVASTSAGRLPGRAFGKRTWHSV